MQRGTIALSFVLMFAFSVTAAHADDNFNLMLLKKGDKAFARRASGDNATKAREAYEKVLAVDPGNVEARWKIGRTLYWVGTHTSKKDVALKAYEDGIRYCQEAVKLNDKCVECHFWLGVSYSKFGETKGILQSLGLVPYAKEAMEKVKALDPKYEWGGAYRVLGRIYNRLPALKGGDNKKAVEYLRKAVELGPTHLMNHRFLAEALLDTGDKDEAQKILKTIIDWPEDKLLKAKKPEMKEEQDEARKIYQKHWEKYW